METAVTAEGAIYGVYKEQACTTKIADLTTDAQGNSNTVEVDAGTYFIKEIKAPKGLSWIKKYIRLPSQQDGLRW